MQGAEDNFVTRTRSSKAGGQRESFRPIWRCEIGNVTFSGASVADVAS
jgi:hypothetical protein